MMQSKMLIKQTSTLATLSRFATGCETPRLRKGFTLLELLVVIAVITAMMGILLPSMHRARLQAKDTQCLSNLRSIYIAYNVYLHDYDRFPELNNQPDDGTWQYNYLIFDGRDMDSNFGPLLGDGLALNDPKVFYCPRQKDPYHSFQTPENPWPAIPLLDTRAAYGRRYHLTGKSLSQLHGNPGILADVFHLSKVIRSAHKNGVNAAYLDGHVQFVHGKKKGVLLDNELARPFQAVDNATVEDIWDEINKAGR